MCDGGADVFRHDEGGLLWPIWRKSRRGVYKITDPTSLELLAQSLLHDNLTQAIVSCSSPRQCKPAPSCSEGRRFYAPGGI